MLLCLHVLEHLTDAKIPPLVEKLLVCGETLIVSIPYEWPRGKVLGHSQDPIDMEKFRGWFAVELRWIEVCEETASEWGRIVGVF